jgi:hypothetical protein
MLRDGASRERRHEGFPYVGNDQDLVTLLVSLPLPEV